MKGLSEILRGGADREYSRYSKVIVTNGKEL